MARAVDKAAKRSRLVEAAVTLFAEAGFQRTSMEDVASAAGVAKGTLYQYFRDKVDLFYACFEWLEHATLERALAAMPAAAGARGKLRTLARVSVETTRRYVAFYPLTLEVWAAASSGASRERFASALREMYGAYRKSVEAILREGQASGEFRTGLDVPAVAATLVGAIDGLLLQFWFDDRLDVDAMACAFVDALLKGLDRSELIGSTR